MDLASTFKDVAGFAVSRISDSAFSSKTPATLSGAGSGGDRIGSDATQTLAPSNKTNPYGASPVDPYFGRDKLQSPQAGGWQRWALIGGAIALVLLGGRALLGRRRRKG